MVARPRHAALALLVLGLPALVTPEEWQCTEVDEVVALLALCEGWERVAGWHEEDPCTVGCDENGAVTMLRLTGLQLTTLPPEIWQLVNLLELCASHFPLAPCFASGAGCELTPCRKWWGRGILRGPTATTQRHRSNDGMCPLGAGWTNVAVPSASSPVRASPRDVPRRRWQ